MEKLVCQSQNKSLINYVLSHNRGITFSAMQKLLRTKQIKVNGARIKVDQNVNVGDIIEIFYNFANNKIEVIYQDDNVVVVNKPAGIEVICENDSEQTKFIKQSNKLTNYGINLIKDNNETDLITQCIKQLDQELYAVHRLDRNTTGLVVFAKNKESRDKLLYAFKHHKIGKSYLAIVVGVPSKTSDKMIAYLKKDSTQSISFVSDFPRTGYDKIITNYKLLKTNDILSLLEVQIETGKTHQIRAHLAHINLPILGDEKYGNKQVNKQYSLKKQMLVAYKLDLSKVFDISEIVLTNIMSKFENMI